MISHKRIPTSMATNDCQLSFLTYCKKSRHNLTVLFNSIKEELHSLNCNNYCYLITYPSIGVIVQNKDLNYLNNNLDEIKEVIERLLWESQK